MRVASTLLGSTWPCFRRRSGSLLLRSARAVKILLPLPSLGNLARLKSSKGIACSMSAAVPIFPNQRGRYLHIVWTFDLVVPYPQESRRISAVFRGGEGTAGSAPSGRPSLRLSGDSRQMPCQNCPATQFLEMPSLLSERLIHASPSLEAESGRM
ncbi:hypothetical protein B0J12DRAFT_51463 [Macrophomina phaseolina]|uniref:Uncharacterized protein n=1 Tax=Macrophomina phaseolina TaxID=35725 RepID=A0ABQ8GEC7_9PEZI|nr:hypothetical protein B0J12DRAFT_51463 [Macrophomina phaseolina]